MYNIPAATFHNVPNELASYSETTITMRHGPLQEPSYSLQLQEHDKNGMLFLQLFYANFCTK